MIRISQDKVRMMHRWMTAETGGDPNVRDIALLNSALESAFATFDGVELYPTKQEKGARIGYSLISNHAFVDGNKRINAQDYGKIRAYIGSNKVTNKDTLESIHTPTEASIPIHHPESFVPVVW